MGDLISFIKDLPQIVILLLIGIIILFVFGIIIHAYISGRKIKIWKFEIEGPNQNLKIKSKQKLNKNLPSICILGSTTKEIQASSEKTEKLKYFYKCFLQEVYRTPFGINTCGAEPLREVIFNFYCEKLYTHSKEQMESINNRIKWYWFPSDDLGFNYEPPFYNSKETENATDRLIEEVQNSNIILAFAGRTGTKTQVELLLNYHKNKKYGIDLEKKNFILLGWFGGSIKEFINENKEELITFLSKYSELEPEKEIHNWHENTKIIEDIAKKLTETIIRLPIEKS